MQSVLKRVCAGILYMFLFATGTLYAQINTDRMMMIGRNALYYEDYVLSIQYFNQVINAKPYLSEPYFYRGVAKLSLEDFIGAENDCSRAISINPYVVNSYQVRGLARVYQRKYKSAIADYVRALRWEPENRSMRHNLILCYLREDRFDEAQLAIDTLLQIAPKYTPAMAMRSHILIERNDTAGALEILDKAIEIDRYEASLYRDRAIIKASLSRYEEAENDLNQSLRYEPDEAGYYIDRALVRFYRNNLRGAMSDYDIAVDIEPNNVLGHYNRGLLRAQVGDDNRAIEDFDIVVDAEPDNMMAVFNRGLLRDKTGNLSGAVQDYTTVLAEYPNFIYGYELRAAARNKLGDRKGSEQDELVVMRDRMSQFNGGADNGKTDDGSGEKDNNDRTRKESDRNVWNYRKIMVSDSDDSKFTSEYRGKVQNRNVEVKLLPSYQFTWFGNVSDNLMNKTGFSNEVEAMNKAGNFLSKIQLTNREIALYEDQIKRLFEDVDSQTLLISDDPDNPYHYFARALDFLLLQDFANAETDFTQSILSGQGLWAAYFGRSMVRMRIADMLKTQSSDGISNTLQKNAGENGSGPNYQLVLNDLNKTIDMEPDFAYAYYNRGNVESAIGDYRAAVSDYTIAIKLNDSFAEAYYNRGLALVFLDRIEEGLSDFGRAGELGIYSAYNVMKRFSPSDN